MGLFSRRRNTQEPYLVLVRQDFRTLEEKIKTNFGAKLGKCDCVLSVWRLCCWWTDTRKGCRNGGRVRCYYGRRSKTTRGGTTEW